MCLSLLADADLARDATQETAVRFLRQLPGDHGGRPLADAERSEERDRLRSVLADLPDRQREAIVLRFLEELSVEETAAAMGCAEGTVKATVHQALRSLRQRLKQWA